MFAVSSQFAQFHRSLRSLRTCALYLFVSKLDRPCFVLTMALGLRPGVAPSRPIILSVMSGETLAAATSFLKDQVLQVKTEADLEEMIQARRLSLIAYNTVFSIVTRQVAHRQLQRLGGSSDSIHEVSAHINGVSAVPWDDDTLPATEEEIQANFKATRTPEDPAAVEPPNTPTHHEGEGEGDEGADGEVTEPDDDDDDDDDEQEDRASPGDEMSPTCTADPYTLDLDSDNEACGFGACKISACVYFVLCSNIYLYIHISANISAIQKRAIQEGLITDTDISNVLNKFVLQTIPTPVKNESKAHDLAFHARLMGLCCLKFAQARAMETGGNQAERRFVQASSNAQRVSLRLHISS